MSERPLAVIPARGGSKRIPRKNLRPLAGRPMIAHTIEAAIASGIFSRIVVTTDSEEIAAAAVEAGAEVPFLRGPALADDVTPVSAATADALERLDPNGDVYGAVAPEDRNILRRIFCDPRSRAANFDWDAVARFVVAAFRIDVARAGVAAEASAAALVEELSRRSPQFAEMWVQSRHNYNGLGRRALAMELRRKGVADELVAEAVAAVDGEAEEEKARELVRKRLRTMSGVDETAKIRRLVGALARKGYAEGLAYRVVRDELRAAGDEASALDEPWS